MNETREWDRSLKRIEEAFEGEETDVLAVLLRDARRSRLPLIPDAGRRLLVIQGLERAERCVEAGDLALGRAELRRAAARVEEVRTPCSSAPGRSGGGDVRDARRGEVKRC